MVAAGTGDNMGAALGLDLSAVDVLVSIGTSGVASTVVPDPVADGSGTVTGFADARGGYLPMVTTMNAAGILDLQARWLGVGHDELAEPRAGLDARSGRGDAVAVLRRRAHAQPARRRRHLDRPDARRPPAPTSPAPRSRRCCARSRTRSTPSSRGPAPSPRRVLLVGGAARSPAVRALAPSILGRDVVLPAEGEYVARGAARQAAWALSGAAQPP